MHDSLDPARAERTPIASLSRSPVVAQGLAEIDEAIRRNFPGNLFADLDLLAATLEARRASAGDASAHATARRIATVHALFGRETPLRFRYTHDFLYGFDWARWVARDPIARASVGPYDDAFLAYSEQRAAELCALVASNDAKYGPLDAHEHRNPFPFRRDDEAERLLLRALAESGAIPVRAWDPSAAPTWDRPFTSIREAKARELGLSSPD